MKYALDNKPEWPTSNDKKFIAALTAIAFAAILLFSCTSSKQVTKKKETVDSTATTYKDTFSVNTKESVWKKTLGEDTRIVWDFFDNDTTKQTGPIIFTQKGDSILIDTGGKKVKKITARIKKFSSDSIATATHDSNGSVQTSKVELKKETTEKTKEKEKSSLFPWWLWVIVAGVLVYVFRNKIFKWA